MPLDTDLNQFPYWDDFNPDNEFYHVGFKPKVSVQARELNQLQSILRHQIEKFGDAVFEKGTIIDGCNFNFLSSFPYVKIKDLDNLGLNVTPASYVGLFAKNSANLQSLVIDYENGFETTDPDLNTLYLSYRNAGNSGNTYQYSSGDILTIFDSNTGIWAVSVNTAGLAFSNSDIPVFTPALAVNVSSGTFTNGDYITQPSTGANLQIVGIDAASLANVGQIILTLKPRGVDLANATANGSQWQVANNDTIRNAANTSVGLVTTVYGSGASADLTTDGSGRILALNMTSRGYGYSVLPTVTVKSPNNATGIAAANLVAQNYVTQVTVANTANAVGNGYAFSVSEGTIYQKGLFLKVDPQTIIVSKYDTTPNNVSVGFRSDEQIIDSNIDTSLLDNANGFTNYQAPGADRIKITPTLVLFGANLTDPNIMPIVSWSEGNPYRQNQATAYSAIGDKMAQELYETEGDFVISRFEVTSRSPYTRSFEGNTVSIITNPGSAYIKGQRVFNNTNYSVDIPKTTDTATSNNRFITLNYGNYIRVKELGGVFQFSTGDTVTFYDTARAFISGTLGANTTPPGNALGTARIRSLTHELGIPGDANTTYRMYLFDIVLNQGVNFRDIRSVAYSGTYNGICDVLLTPDATTNANVAILANTDFDYLLFDAGATTLKNATNVTYTYRTIDQTTTFANTGILTKNISTTPSETFPYVGTLNSTQLQDLYVVPVGNSLIASANSSGTANALSTSNVITGTSSTWLTDFAQGDYVYLFQNSTVHDVRRVISVANNTQMQLDANVGFTGNNNAVYRYFPQNVPIPLGLRTGLTANVSANQQLLTVSLGTALQGAVTVNTAIAVNITRSNVAPVSKSAARDNYVKIQMSNNAGGTSGPWCLGVSDIFRLKRVFMDTANTVSTSSPEVTSYFYIDHKQNEDYLDLGYLYVKPNSGLTIGSGNFLLVQFDAYQTTGTGYADTVSYIGANAATIASNDSTPLYGLGSTASSWEIPEVIGSKGQYFDLMKYFDFRPIAANSVSASTNAAAAPINPTYSLSFGNTANPANDKKFPLPDSALSYNMEQYMWRTDAVFADKTGKIGVVRGIPSVNKAKAPAVPADSIRLVNVYLPPYPCLPAATSPMQTEIITTRMGNQNLLFKRVADKTIAIPSAPGTAYDTQPGRYTMAKVGEIDRRVKALEYYNSLNALQSDMVNRIVPSSNDPSINRFKFGVMVDAFDNTLYQDVTNPAYAAAISGSNMTPPTVDWVIHYGAAKSATASYIDYSIINQPDATFHPNTAPTPNTVITPSTTTANVWMLRTDHLAPSQGGEIVLTDYAYPVFANVSGPATLYFYINPTVTFLANGMIYFSPAPPPPPGGEPDNFYIYQGNTLIADAYTNATQLSNTDIAYLKSKDVPGDFFINDPLNTKLGRVANNWVNGAGRIDWIHNPALGNQYTIVSKRLDIWDHWKWGLRYPSDFGSQVIVSPSSTAATYAGKMDVEPPTLLLAMTTPTGHAVQVTAENNQGSSIGIPNSPTLGTTNYTALGTSLENLLAYDDTYFTGGGWGSGQYSLDIPETAVASTTYMKQCFGITVYGLKPSTQHDLYVNSIKKTSSTLDTAHPSNGMGAPLITDANGVLRFNYYFNGLAAEQDVVTNMVSPSGGQKDWAAEVAASMSQPLSVGAITLTVSAPGSSATFQLQVVADANMLLSTVTQTMTFQSASQLLTQSMGPFWGQYIIPGA